MSLFFHPVLEIFFIKKVKTCQICTPLSIQILSMSLDIFGISEIDFLNEILELKYNEFNKF